VRFDDTTKFYGPSDKLHPGLFDGSKTVASFARKAVKPKFISGGGKGYAIRRRS